MTTPQRETNTPPLDHLSSRSPLGILCVDDEQHILAALRRLFHTERFTVLTATSGREGLDILKSTENIALILSDQQMPEMTGTTFLEAAKSRAPNVIRFLMTGHADIATALAAINEGGVHRFIVKPWDNLELLGAVREGVQRYRSSQIDTVLAEVMNRYNDELVEWNTSLKSRVLQQTETLRLKLAEVHKHRARNQQISDVIIKKYADLLEQRHQRLGQHSRTVAALAHAMASALQLPRVQREEIANAALLHDLGLVCLSDRVLSRNMNLMSSDEVAGYRLHPVKGQELIGISEELQGIGQIIRHHHEEFDGSGYPDGLKGEQIPLAARIIHVADYLDHAFSREIGDDVKYVVTRKMNAEMNRRFDPALATAAARAVMEILVTTPAPHKREERELVLAQIEEGMILSQDTFSVTGTLLLERGTRLDKILIEGLRRYHGQDQNNTKVWVLK